MRPVFQTRFGDPEGNCFNACVASILECELSDLPDYNDLPDGTNWLEWLNEHLATKGVSVFYAEASPENPFIGYIPKGTHFIASGDGPRGVKHSVVMRALARVDENGQGEHKDELAHDPFPGGAGFVRLSNICLVVRR